MVCPKAGAIRFCLGLVSPDNDRHRAAAADDPRQSGVMDQRHFSVRLSCAVKSSAEADSKAATMRWVMAAQLTCETGAALTGTGTSAFMRALR
jgi:hypothetical protein